MKITRMTYSCISHSRSAARWSVLQLSSARHHFVPGDAPSRKSMVLEFDDGRGRQVRFHVWSSTARMRQHGQRLGEGWQWTTIYPRSRLCPDRGRKKHEFLSRGQEVLLLALARSFVSAQPRGARFASWHLMMLSDARDSRYLRMKWVAERWNAKRELRYLPPPTDIDQYTWSTAAAIVHICFQACWPMEGRDVGTTRKDKCVSLHR